MRRAVRELVTGLLVGAAIIGFLAVSMIAYNRDFHVRAEEETAEHIDLLALMMEMDDVGYAVYEEVGLSFEEQVEINSIANNYRVPISLVWAIAKKESQFNPEAIGDDGDSIGLMQIQTKWHEDRMRELGVEMADLIDPVENAMVAIDYLAELYEQRACWPWVIMAYNEGPEKADAEWKNETYRTLYSLEVLSYMRDFTR